MTNRLLAGVLGGAALLAISSPAAAQFGGGPCDRATLQMLADKYVQAQEEGLPLRIPMGNWVVYNENGALSTMSRAPWLHGTARGHRRIWVYDKQPGRACPAPITL